VCNFTAITCRLHAVLLAAHCFKGATANHVFIAVDLLIMLLTYAAALAIMRSS